MMKKVLNLILCFIILFAMLPQTVTSEEINTIQIQATKNASFNNKDEYIYSDDNILAASDSKDNWQAARSFTDLDGATVTTASIDGTGFNTPRNAVIAFPAGPILSVITPDDIKSVTLTVTIKNVKQVTANARLAVYGNTLEQEWDMATSNKTTFGADASSANLDKLPLLGLTDAITVGSWGSEVQSGQSVSVKTLALKEYVKEMLKEGYSELTFRFASPLGGIRIYSVFSNYKPTLTIEYDDSAAVVVNHVIDGQNYNSITLSDQWIGTEYELTDDEAPRFILIDDEIYIRDNVNGKITITPTEKHEEVDIEYKKVTIANVEPVNVRAYVNTLPKMPSAVEVEFSDSQKTQCNVIWDMDDIALKIKSEGVYEIRAPFELFPSSYAVCNLVVEEFEPNESVLTNSGGWNWYAEPSGMHIQPGDELALRYQNNHSSNNGYVFTKDRTYFGWCKDDGTVEVAQYDHDTGEYKVVTIHEKLESDDHNNPAVIILPDGRIMVWYSKHTNEPYMYYRVSKYPEDISKWHDIKYYYCESNFGSSKKTYNATYPAPFIVDENGEDVIYLFWRGVNWQPTLAKFSIPDENGECRVLMGQTQILNASVSSKDDGGAGNSGLRPYAKYHYEYETGKIHITFTYTHPDNVTGDNSIGRKNPIYYMYFNVADQKFYSPLGNAIMSLPRENATGISDTYNGSVKVGNRWGVIVQNAITIFKSMLVFNPADNTQRRGWTWDIMTNEKGEPCVLYVDVTDNAPDENGNPPTRYYDVSDADRSHHYYYYARFDNEKKEWVTTFLTYGGKWFHENAVLERCYSGGLSFDHNYKNANVIYLAIPTMGEYGNIFEIYRWESDDYGATWKYKEPITQNSKINNSRPNAIYNYKQNEDGTHGPRILWMRGEYRYWTNYLYKTGIMTDFSGIMPQDDPEMKADAFLYTQDGEEVRILTSDLVEKGLKAQFNITNISVGDGDVLITLAHYDKNNNLKKVVTDRVFVPNRSIPQIPVIGAPKGVEEGTLSVMGTEEITAFLEYTPEEISDGDKIKLIAVSFGNHKIKPINSIPFEVSTKGDKYLVRDTFSYDSHIVLEEGKDYNGWIATLNKPANNEFVPSFGPKNYVAFTRNPFGNTGLHLYHGVTSKTTGNPDGAGGILVSRALPEIDEDYVIRFNVRWINELDWWNTKYNGFSLGHGIPEGHSDFSKNPSAWQMRYIGQENGTNGRRGYYISYDTTDFFQGQENKRIEYVEGIYGNKSDKLMEGALIEVKLVVRPKDKIIECYMDDGYRTGSWVQSYNQYDSNGNFVTDWSDIKINTITFNSGIGYTSQLYIDDFRVYLLEDETK